MNKSNNSTVLQFLLTSANYVKGTNNKYRYDLPSNIDVGNNDQIAVQCASIYNNSFNIRAAWNNNKFVIFFDNFNINNIPSQFTKGNSYTDPFNSSVVINKKYVQISIPDGYYDVVALNSYLMQQCLLMGFYLKGLNSGDNMYFISLLVNPNMYKMEVDMFVVPNGVPTGYSLPSQNAFSLPASTQTPFLYFPSAPASNYGSFASIFGFPNSTFFPYSPLITSTGSNGNVQTLSTLTPTLNPITTYVFTCNLVNNKYCNPPNLFFQMPINAAYGDMMVYNSYPIFITARASNYAYIEICLYDQFLNDLVLNDTEFNITILWSKNIIL